MINPPELVEYRRTSDVRCVEEGRDGRLRIVAGCDMLSYRNIVLPAFLTAHLSGRKAILIERAEEGKYWRVLAIAGAGHPAGGRLRYRIKPACACDRTSAVTESI